MHKTSELPLKRDLAAVFAFGSIISIRARDGRFFSVPEFPFAINCQSHLLVSEKPGFLVKPTKLLMAI